MPSALKVGAKGGTYYVSNKGKKVYADKLPGAKEPKKPKASKDKKAKAEAGGKVHPSHAKKVEGFKKKGQATGEKFEGQELFIGGKGNHFYVNPKTGKKVIFTKKKSKELGLGGKKAGGAKPKKSKTLGNETASTKKHESIKDLKKQVSQAKSDLKEAEYLGDDTTDAEGWLEASEGALYDAQQAKKKPTDAKTKKKIDNLKADLKMEKTLFHQPKGGSTGANKIQAKIDKLEGKAPAAQTKATASKGKGHPKEAKYEQHKTAHKTADGQQVFKGKGGNYFTVHPTKGTKQIITKASAKDQGFHGGGKAKASKGSLATKASYDAAKKNFKPTSLVQNSAAINKAAMLQYNSLPYTQQDTLRQYTAHHYTGINKSLRQGEGKMGSAAFKSGKAKAAHMDKTFSNAKVSTAHDYRVFRGTSTNGERIPPPVGGLYEDKGFSSTSFSKQSASEFKGGKKNRMLMTIDVPKGSKALYVDKKSAHKGEKELLVDRGAKIRITGRKKVGNVWHVTGMLETTHNGK